MNALMTRPPSPNTVHLSILMAFLMLMRGSDLFVRGRSGKLLILRLTPRKLRRLRLETTRSWRVSSSTASRKQRLCRGGPGRAPRECAADDANGMEEGEAIGILVGFQRRFVHQATNGEVSHHEPVKFLPNQIRALAAQDDLGAPQMGLEFIQRGFDFPALMVERRQLCGGSCLIIQNGGDEPIDRLRVGDAVQAVVNDAHLHAVGLASPILYGWIDTAQIGTILQSVLTD